MLRFVFPGFWALALGDGHFLLLSSTTQIENSPEPTGVYICICADFQNQWHKEYHLTANSTVLKIRIQTLTKSDSILFLIVANRGFLEDGGLFPLQYLR